MFSDTLKALNKLSKYLSILFLFLIACYVLVARIFLFYLPDHSDDVAKYLSAQLEIPIDFRAISSQWEGFDPVIKIHGLSVGEQDQLSIDLVSLNFSFIQSLINAQPKFDRILIKHTSLSLTQSIDGHWRFLGFDTKNMQASDDSDTENNQAFFEILSFFNGTTLNLQELNAAIFNDTGKVRTLRAPKLNINYKDEQLFASGQLLESQGDKTLLNFSLKGYGLSMAHKLKGTLFIEARSSEFFGELLSVYDWQKISIQDVEASGRAWVNFDDFNINSIYGDVQVRELNWSVGEETLKPINNLAFTYLWQDEQDEQKLSVENFAFQWLDIECEPINAKVHLNKTGLELQADKVEIHCISPLMLSLGILPKALDERITVSNPQGYLRNISFRQFKDTKDHSSGIDGIEAQSADTKPTFEFEAMLSQVSVDAYESTPSGKNLEGYVFAKNDAGFVSFLSEDFELGFPTLFLEPWELKRAEGIVSWEVDESDIVISSDGLRLWRDGDSLVYGDFMLMLNDEQSEDYISLSIGMQDILFPDAVKFIPYYAIDNGLYSWLSESLVSGMVSSGVYYGYGAVESDSPENSFTSSIYLKSQSGVLMFDKAWPYLENLNAEIVIQNGQVWVDSEHASISGTTLDNVKAYLPEGLTNKTNFIDISASSLLTKELIDYWLTESPISENTKAIAQQLEIENGAKTNIHLKIPVSQPENESEHQELEYYISSVIEEGNFTHLPSNLNFSEVNGVVNVDSKKGLMAEDVNLKVFDKSATLSIATDNRVDSSNKAYQVTKLLLNGELDVESAFTYFDAVKPSFVNGLLNYSAELTLPSDDSQYPLLAISSDLKGVSCQCPLPFDKRANEIQALNISLLLKPEQSYLEGELVSDRAPKVHSELLFVNDKLSFGEFLIGDAQVKDTNIKGINIAADLDNVNLSVWLDFLQQALNEKLTKDDNDHDELIKQIQINISRLDAFDHIFKDSSLLIKPFQDSWQVDVSGEDAKGSILLSDSDDKLNLNFEKLNLVNKVDVDKTQDLLVKKDVIDPRTFPLLTFHAKNLLLNSKSIGSWQFDLVPDKSGSVFQNIKGHIKGSNILGQLNWRFDQGIQNTIATLSMSGSDISSVFNVFDFPTLMTSSRYESEMALVWPDSPLNFSLAKLSGNISMSLEEGFLKTEDQKTGVLRLFGVLNAESIKRRLKLDFSDLYKSGVGYDTFIAKASMDQGLLILTEPLVIDGPAGKYTLNGRSDLATKGLDIDMLVELPFSQNVPLAALVLGAPQIGGLVWVADKLLGEPLSALTTSRYDITGTWDKPRVDLQQAMNASKKDRSREKGTRNVGK